MDDHHAPVPNALARLIETAMGSEVPILVEATDGETSPGESGTYFQPGLPSVAGSLDEVPVGATAIAVVPRWGRTRDAINAPFRTLELAERTIASILEDRTSARRVGFLVPASTLANSSSRPFREHVGAGWDLAVVAVASRVILEAHAGFQCAFVVVVPTGSGDGLTRFFRTGRDGLTEDALDAFHHLMRRKGGRNDYGFVFRLDERDDRNWGFDTNDPLHKERAAELSGLGAVRTLGDVFEILRAGGIRGGRPAGRVLRGRDIGRDGRLSDPLGWGPADSTRPIRTPVPLQIGDFVARSIVEPIGRGRSGTSIPVARIDAEHLPASAADTVLVLRPKQPINDVEAEILLAYLRSARMAEQVAAAGHAGFHLLPSLLRDVPVPKPDAPLLHAVGELLYAKNTLERWAQVSTTTIDAALALPSVLAARASILEQGRELRQRVDAMRQLDDLGYRVRTRYPYPVALQWRTVEASRSADDDGKALAAILECFEVLLSFIASTVLVVSRAGGYPIGARADLARKFQGKSGPTLGDWTRIVESTEGRWAAALPDDDYLAQVRTFAGATADNRKALSSLRNDIAHLRKPSDQARAVASALDALRSVLDAAEFLTDVSLVWVKSVNANVLAGSATLTAQRLVGDHRIVRTETIELNRIDVEAGSLYLADVLGGFHLLRPVLVGGACGKCGAWHTFHVDSLNEDAVRYRSLESGHIVEHPKARQDLVAVDLA